MNTFLDESLDLGCGRDEHVCELPLAPSEDDWRRGSIIVSERASHLAGGYPVMRQQLDQGAGLLRRQAHEHVLQVGVRIVPVQAG